MFNFMLSSDSLISCVQWLWKVCLNTHFIYCVLFALLLIYFQDTPLLDPLDRCTASQAIEKLTSAYSVSEYAQETEARVHGISQVVCIDIYLLFGHIVKLVLSCLGRWILTSLDVFFFLFAFHLLCFHREGLFWILMLPKPVFSCKPRHWQRDHLSICPGI